MRSAHQRSGHIEVGYAATGGGWTMTVVDDGIGIDNVADVTSGLGTIIVNVLARHLDASVDAAGGRPGTIVTITSPIAMTNQAVQEVEVAV